MNNTLEKKISVSSILKFTFPSIIMMVIMSLYTVVDGTFVSRLVGTDAFSAINIVYPLIGLVVGLGTMFGSGTTAIISKKLGEGKREEANRILTFIILFTTILGVFISILCFFFLENIIYILGANKDIYHYCYSYLFPIIFFFPASILQLEFQSLYVADGKPQIGLFVTILGGVANIVLDYIFIAEFNMGIAGAAIATGIGYLIPALYGLFYFAFHKKGNFCFVKPKARWRALGFSITNGSSEMVSCLSTSITTFLFNIIMMKLIGQDGVAAISVILYLDFVLTAISLGYSMGVAPLISYNYGCNNTNNLKKLYRLSTLLCIAVGIGTTAGTVLFAEQLTSIFTVKSSVVYELAVAALRIYAFGYLFREYNIFCSAMFTAFEDGKSSAILSFMRTLVFLSISLILLSSLFGVNGVWYSSVVAEFLAVTLSIFFTLKYRKKYHYLDDNIFLFKKNADEML